MFLKRVEMQGFKSFADKTIIEFDHSITGIVGPNGCGKSNITDAIRWVLGEQSAKSMRGDKMNDVIFAGSANRRRVNLAEVTLVFDNRNHILNRQENEVEVTRRLYRESGEANYLINRRPVRLKDIVDLFLDTGLGKDSLSIISQGNVLSFAESKPLERRSIFEEAAGVAKYKKRKLETLSRLERGEQNLEQNRFILAELEKQVNPLKRQAKKAELYRQKKERLQKIEIAVLVNSIRQLYENLEALDQQLFDSNTKKTVCQTDIEVGESQIQVWRKEIHEMDHRVQQLQDRLMNANNSIVSLEARKSEWEEKSKYILEVGNLEQQQQELQHLYQNAKLEYEDRLSRQRAYEQAIQLSQSQLASISTELLDYKNELDISSFRCQKLENHLQVLEQLQKNPFNHNAGLKTIVEHQASLDGIIGVIGQLLQVIPNYEEAISTALGGAINQVLTNNEVSARHAIDFLKRNQAGRCTFLPLNVCQARYVSKEALTILQSQEGYLGLASDYATIDSKYQAVIDALLQNVLVVENLEKGNEISALVHRQYKIVTLDGEVIHRGGSMTGGRLKQETNLMTIKKEFNTLQANLDALLAKKEIARRNYEKAEANRRKAASTLEENRLALASLVPVVEAKKARMDKYWADLERLGKQEKQSEEGPSFIFDLNKAYQVRDEVTKKIQALREQRYQAENQLERKEAKLRQKRSELNDVQQDSHRLEIEKSKQETKLESNLQRLSSEYKMTYQFAKKKVDVQDFKQEEAEVQQLCQEIEALGNINMDAPEQYAEVNERYETLEKHIQEIETSISQLLKAVDEMDDVMKSQFQETFEQVNEAFGETFSAIYGGGKAFLRLQDPNDLLGTGIEIFAQPPGKTVHNNMLFSGGEKSLIALSVLFAILKVKPIPLVILDEVEAALDPANVSRFAQYLTHYVDKSQFLVVTHRPGTMEKADILYGVTMQAQGVSSLLKVNLVDAMHFSDDNAKGDEQ
ncbi:MULTISPECIES: AAA family ATPase [Terrabacteria group]|uniref:AAA family ATPase n=1 Tax=Bacillati TaxID=1783272 RepID=UPI001C6DE392|nr:MULTISPECIES: AAA family ATPase [Terrabacteria group]MBW9211830.1 AAA family ATPase [Trueperella sp. zg.1013]